MRDTIQIEQNEPFGPPAAGSLLLHLAIFGGMALAIYLHGRFHGQEWGNNAPPGAIQATLVSSAPTIPLPQVAPPTPNVLATQLPSPAPAPPSKVTLPLEEPQAIPIPVRQPKLKPAEKPREASPEHSQPLNQQNRANFGEAAPTQLAHAPAPTVRSSSSPVAVNGGDFAARFPWYVDKITRMVSQNWYTQQIDPSTRVGSQVSATFTIGRDGTVSSIHIAQASQSPSLNRTAVEAVQRVGSFGPLPDQYTGSNVSVEYTFTYDQPSH
jgi:protein TonB